MDEALLLAAILWDRNAYERATRSGLEANEFTDTGKLLVQCAEEQYQRDKTVKAVSLDILESQLKRKLGKRELIESVMAYVGTLPADASQVNIAEEYRLLRRSKVAMNLASRLASNQHDEETEGLLAKYVELNATAGPEGETYRLTAKDFEEGERTGLIELSPISLNNFIGGGVLRGHNITVYGRPESGKSLFALNMAAFVCVRGGKVLYVANEEPPQDITRRLLSRLSNQDIRTLRDAGAVTAAMRNKAYENWHLLHKAGAGIKDIRATAASVRPDVIIVDQLKNLQSAEDNRALQLDKLAREVRELGIAYNAVTISVTQAGDSASNKLVLQMNDIEWSNTGIPGAADLMLGIGVNSEYDLQNKRCISVTKNKINGRHGNFPVWVNPQRTIVSSKPT